MDTFLNGRVTVKTGDITREQVDAVVNAANATLLGGGGVDGAIHRAGGREILNACKRIRRDDYPSGLPTGQAVATTAGDLPATYVIHTVGPDMRRSVEDGAALLAACYANSLSLARELSCRSVAFPSISTGIFGYPKRGAAQVVSRTVTDYCGKYDAPESIILVFFSDADRDIILSCAEFA